MKKPNPHRQERDYLLYLARTAKKPRGRSAAPITEADYAAVYTVPVNNKAPIHGPCLIWRRGLNTGGYGQTSHNGLKVLAHRLAYEITRGSIPHNMHILHMCNRRSCIQPAHLYAGTPQENADDKKDKSKRFSGTEAAFEKLNRQVAECPKHVCPEPSHTQLSHQPQPEHKCNFVIATGDTKLCDVCYQPPLGTSLWWFLLEMAQQQIVDPQKHETQSRKQYLDLNPKSQNRPVPW